MTSLPSPLNLEVSLNDEQFLTLCQNHPELRLERNADGSLIIMSPTGGVTGDRNAEIIYQLRAWNRQYRLGKSFDSSTGFVLPNGAIRSPDTAWIAQQRWDSLTQQQQEQLVPLCPDFVVELLSPSDNLHQTRQKMQEYLDQGVRLGWLILPQQKMVEIYRPPQSVEVQENPTTLSGETVLPEFELDLIAIW